MLIRTIFIFVLLINCVFALPYTEDDRDRSIRLEEGQKSLQKQIDDLKIQLSDFKADLQKQVSDQGINLQKQIKDQGFILQSQIDDIKIFLYWGFGILFSGMGILIGFVLWDRRSVLTPV